LEGGTFGSGHKFCILRTKPCLPNNRVNKGNEYICQTRVFLPPILHSIMDFVSNDMIIQYNVNIIVYQFSLQFIGLLSIILWINNIEIYAEWGCFYTKC